MHNKYAHLAQIRQRTATSRKLRSSTVVYRNMASPAIMAKATPTRRRLGLTKDAKLVPRLLPEVDDVDVARAEDEEDELPETEPGLVVPVVLTGGIAVVPLVVGTEPVVVDGRAPLLVPLVCKMPVVVPEPVTVKPVTLMPPNIPSMQ